ncbi:spore germination protein [Keratinibaculum paraultunense]|uniref:Spore germination protein n=1 Tax=Keratinibaculum paraultunense TaxID=1278232 RepID=A0A4V2UU25_9FIRM|nr:endospore germination permease [Keratinibaculum paraultunense]QQY79903.1 endospore germination permease [Keratinibaculum paraultunense]TCS88793.1 spore germination protein [Keratinibaculum paraultunense]
MQKNKISNIQIKALVITSVVGVGMLSLPSDVAMIMGNDGWMGILIGGLLNIPFIIMMNKIFKLEPGKDFFQLGEEVLNLVVFKIFLIINVVYLILMLGYTNRIFADVIKTYLLETTPIRVVFITMLLAASYIARSPIEVIARMAVIINPIIIGFIIFLVIINIPHMDITEIYPLFQVSYRDIPKGIVTALFSYTGYEIILLALPQAEDKKNTLKYSISGMLIVIAIYLTVFFISLSQYGIHQLKREIWPTIAIVKEIDLPGYFLENLDGIVMAVWVMVVYEVLGSTLHLTGKMLSGIFNTKTHDIFILPLLPIIYIISLLPKNLVETEQYLGNILNYLSVITIMIIPTIIFIATYISNRRKKQ